uniref:Uncharacterized protein n=1 Tax=Panagrolaimus superbus TaxID=310955 RepID=A0A914YLH7_9BILA
MISKIFLIFLLVLSVAVGDATQIFKSVRHERRSHRGLKTAIVKESVQHPRLFTHAFLAPPLHASAKASYNFAVDIVDYGSASTFQCIYKQGYNAVFIQGYSPSNGGSVNTNLISNLNNAAVAGLGNEIYVTPTMAKTGQTQFDAVYNQLKNSGVNVRSIWLQVTSPINWGNNVQNNVNLITSFASRANHWCSLDSLKAMEFRLEFLQIHMIGNKSLEATLDFQAFDFGIGIIMAKDQMLNLLQILMIFVPLLVGLLQL